MNQLVSIALGGAVGAVLRHSIALWVQTKADSTFPWGTLSVNLIGCFVIGLLFHLFDTLSISANQRAFIFTGMLGALTTFSTYGLDTVKLFRAGESVTAVSNLLISNTLGILLVFAGIACAKLILSTVHNVP